MRPLPHQLEAVYERILPQVRLRFLLADDPGAGKTIMAGLLLKELKLRQVIERVLILAPAPLTLQWQDELSSKFSETYEVINSNLAKGQLAGNPWERFRQCIASIDFAKREDILSGILQVDWDLVIIDEAHKCSARKLDDPSGRYKLARELSRISERILLLTATPHQGNAEQFHNFLLLLDPEQFISETLNPEMLSLEDSPWFLRRIKEELKDFDGRKLFKERHAITVPFELSEPEKYLYDRVTKYINRYLGKTKGRKQAAVALARTVLQRRLASSLNAIFSSLKKRRQRFVDLLEELNNLSPVEQRDRLMSLGKIVDLEQDSDDCDEEQLENLAIESTVVEQIDELREELDELERLLSSPDYLHDLAPMELKISKLKIKNEIIQELSVSEPTLTELKIKNETLPELSLVAPTPQEQQEVEEWLKVNIQIPLMREEQQKRQRELTIRQDYLSRAMESAIREAQKNQMKLAAKVAKGDETYRVARDSAQKKVQNLQERYKSKQTELDYLKLVRLGNVVYLGTALVYPGTAIAARYSNMRNDPEVEAFAMQWVMDYERQRGWQPEDVSQKRDGSGFDIRSVEVTDSDTEIPEVRRIEVKGRAQLNSDVSLTVNEWRKAQQLGDSYWLYVVWGCKTANPRLLTIQNPAKKLMGDAKEIKQVTRYLVGADALEKKAES